MPGTQYYLIQKVTDGDNTNSGGNEFLMPDDAPIMSVVFMFLNKKIYFFFNWFILILFYKFEDFTRQKD
jgi:hypothetical protein